MPELTSADRTRLAVILAALAGAVDALGFITLGGFFVSFMTGNTTRLAVGLAQGHLQEAVTGGAIVVLFVAGAMAGFAYAHAARRPRRAASGLLTVLLAFAAILHDAGASRLAIAAMTFAMGAENAIFQTEPGQSIGLTYMTGTLVKMAKNIVEALHGGPPRLWVGQFVLWASLAVGGAIGGLLDRAIGLDALWPLAGVAGLVTWGLGRLPPAPTRPPEEPPAPRA